MAASRFAVDAPAARHVCPGGPVTWLSASPSPPRPRRVVAPAQCTSRPSVRHNGNSEPRPRRAPQQANKRAHVARCPRAFAGFTHRSHPRRRRRETDVCHRRASPRRNAPTPWRVSDRRSATARTNCAQPRRKFTTYLPHRGGAAFGHEAAKSARNGTPFKRSGAATPRGVTALSTRSASPCRGGERGSTRRASDPRNDARGSSDEHPIQSISQRSSQGRRPNIERRHAPAILRIPRGHRRRSTIPQNPSPTRHLEQGRAEVFPA